MPFAGGQVLTKKGAAIFTARMIGATPAQAEMKYAGMGTGATAAARTAAVTDTVLSAEVESRIAATLAQVTTTDTNDTIQATATITASAGRTVDEAGLFDASSAGNMGLSATFTGQPLLTGDSLQFIWKDRIIAG